MIIYNIWKAQCSLVFHQVKAALVELVTNIWLDIVHSLKVQWDGIVGDFDAKTAQCREFSVWTTIPFMTSKNDTPFWHFQPLKWLFPPPIT